MPDVQPVQLGKLVEVTHDRFVAQRLAPPRQATPDDDGDAEIAAGQVGTYALVATDNGRILCQVTDSRLAFDVEPACSFTGLLPLGEIASDGQFSRGIGRYPQIGSAVYSAGSKALDGMFAGAERAGLDLGRLSQYPDLSVYADPSLLFNRHLAILGQSGSGKSWAVTSLIQRTVATMPKAHIVLLDLHGEYGWRNAEGRLHSAFPAETVRHIDARSLEIPYWLLTYSEIVDLLVDRNDPNASLHISYLRDVLLDLRRQGNEHLGLDRLSVDSPVYFSLDALYDSCQEANEQQFDFGKRNGPLFGVFNEFLMRFQSMYNDSRYDFLLRPKRRTESGHLEGLMRDFIGLGNPKRQITVIDLSSVPNDVRPTVTAQVSRLAFEFNYWNPARRDFPVLLVCEEAHQYIPRDEQGLGVGSTHEMERIAKEGRKYGVALCVVSQRPTELSETVLSQCGTFICLRTTNPEDQNYIRRLMPAGEQGLAGMLSTLRRGEALGVGDALSLPTRFRIYPPNPPPARSDVPVATAWRSGPDDLDVGDIVDRWWQQRR
jgi:DNA helicase HerA-like ATPase